jgi:hypothetical protein
MNIENILNNNDYKLIFLKAILLGINYGKSSNIDYYIKNVNNEINKINEMNNNPKIIQYNNIIKKIENIILNLEYQNNLNQSNIQKLSHNNYVLNVPKINILKNNSIILNSEIEKNKINLKNVKEQKQNLENESLKKSNKKNENLVNELEKTLGSLSNFFI